MTPEDGSMPTLVDTTANVIDVTTDVGLPLTGNEVPDTPALEEEPERERELVFELRDSRVRPFGAALPLPPGKPIFSRMPPSPPGDGAALPSVFAPVRLASCS